MNSIGAMQQKKGGCKASCIKLAASFQPERVVA
jgi:hypothetical protein